MRHQPAFALSRNNATNGCDDDKNNGFHIIGFDRYAYSNNGPEEHNMRIEMGMNHRIKGCQ